VLVVIPFQQTDIDCSWQRAMAYDVDSSGFKPIDGLFRQDGDVTLVLLFNFAGYAEPVEDPWFLANEETKYESGATRYTSPTTISVVSIKLAHHVQDFQGLVCLGCSLGSNSSCQQPYILASR